MRNMIMRFLLLFFIAFSFAIPAMATTKNDDVPFRADAGLITAEYYLATGKYTQALQALGAVLNRHPRNADAFVYRGYAYQRLDDRRKARESYERALAIDPAHLGAHRYMGGLYIDENKIAQAMEHLQAIRLVCGHTECAEQTELESAINNYRAKP